jgi:hypothetical protein
MVLGKVNLEKINDDGIDSWKLDGAAVKAKFPK